MRDTGCAGRFHREMTNPRALSLIDDHARRDVISKQNIPAHPVSRIPHLASFAALALLICAFLTGCSAVERVGMRVLYRRAALPEQQITRDIPYVRGSTLPKHQLDLFHPAGRGWPVFVFIHGGSWDSGDKALNVADQDVYGNIGRFYAARGIGVAVINYRLQPDATWREQIDDASQAVAWVRNSIAQYGGDANRVFVGGHSAGAHLAAHVALRGRVAGAICISGAGYDMADAETYRLGNKPAFYAERFAQNGANPDWQRNASPATSIHKNAPPFLLLYAQGDSAPLRRQSRHMHGLLQAAGVKSKLIEIPGESHIRIVLALTRADKAAAPEILRFIEEGKMR